ncbi:hypothetical protein MGA3_00950 [Bacillus methanolicus MGA3]|nr:hypothetical protein MGA3_00950 [Bacillus methanolicus MGA3]
MSKNFSKSISTHPEIVEHTIPLVSTIRKLIIHGLSRDEILDITNISSEEFNRILSENKNYQLPHIYLYDEESKEFERLLADIRKSKDKHELIFFNQKKEGKRKAPQRFLSAELFEIFWEVIVTTH